MIPPRGGREGGINEDGVHDGADLPFARFCTKLPAGFPPIPQGCPMGLLEKLRGEFIDIIEWTEPSQNEALAYRFPRHNNEIKYGAKLTVREGQAAVFVNEGQLADVFSPALPTLETRNMPIRSPLMGWKYAFSSP